MSQKFPFDNIYVESMKTYCTSEITIFFDKVDNEMIERSLSGPNWIAVKSFGLFKYSLFEMNPERAHVKAPRDFCSP